MKKRKNKRKRGKDGNTDACYVLFPEMVGGSNEVNYIKVLLKSSNVVNMLVLELSLFEVFTLNQEITWIAHNKVEKKREKKMGHNAC